MILERFILDTFDTPSITPAQFIKDDELDINNILSHPVLKLNTTYCQVWHHLFGVFPTKQDFTNFLSKHPPNQIPSHTDINAILNSFILLSTMRIPVNTQELSKVTQLVNNIEYVKAQLIDKWCHRYQVQDTFQDQPSLIHKYLAITKASPHTTFITTPSQDTTCKSPTGNFVPHLAFNTPYTTSAERDQFVLYQDLHFLRKITNTGVIITHELTHSDTLTALTEAIEEAHKAEAIITTSSHTLPLKLAKCAFDLATFKPPVPLNDPTLNTLYQKAIYKALVQNSRDVPYLQFAASYYNKNATRIKALSKTSKTPSNIAILVDNRPNIMSVLSMLFTAINLARDQWDIRIYTSTASAPFYTTHLGHIATIHELQALNTKHFTIDTYNQILMDPAFWKTMSTYTKCLVIQDDGIILRPGVEEFLKYDYVGAPWIDGPGNEYLKSHVNTNLVGNGGLSLRSIQAMIDITTTYQDEKHWTFYHNLVKIPEDVYFVKCMCSPVNKGKYILPTTQQASAFSMEQIYNPNTLGVHKCWMYIPLNLVSQYFESLLK